MTKSQKDYDLKAEVKLLEKMGYGDLPFTQELRAASEGKPPAGLSVKPLKPRPRVKGAGGGLWLGKKRGKKIVPCGCAFECATQADIASDKSPSVAVSSREASQMGNVGYNISVMLCARLQKTNQRL